MLTEDGNDEVGKSDSDREVVSRNRLGKRNKERERVVEHQNTFSNPNGDGLQNRKN